MTILFKVAPQPDGEGILTVSAKPYGSVSLTPGERVFLWWSEKQGGTGLVGHGLCISAEITTDCVEADVEIIVLRGAGVGFGRDQLRALRDVPGIAPEATLATKLYKHSLNKAVELSQAEEAFLDGLF